MSIFTEFSRYGAARKARRDALRTERALNALPPEIQKDIGWPVAQRERQPRGMGALYRSRLF
jgi:hypothetical protein